MKPSAFALNLIKGFEGLRLRAYQDQAGIWTIGYGNTYYEDGRAADAGNIVPLMTFARS